MAVSKLLQLWLPRCWGCQSSNLVDLVLPSIPTYIHEASMYKKHTYVGLNSTGSSLGSTCVHICTYILYRYVDH